MVQKNQVERTRRYRKKHSEKVIKQRKEYRNRNRERNKENRRKWRECNPEKVIEQKWRQYKIVNPKTNKFLTWDEFENMVIDQLGLCLICRACVGNDLVPDHNHNTGFLRGLICPQCNRALGLFRDSFHTMLQAALYLYQYDRDGR
jgi:hypothetical protein